MTPDFKFKAAIAINLFVGQGTYLSVPHAIYIACASNRKTTYKGLRLTASISPTAGYHVY